MDISCAGKNGFKIKGKMATCLIDNGAVVLEGENSFKITDPGEYEVGGVSVIGVQDQQGKIYVIEMDGIRTALLDNPTDKLSEKQIEEIGPVDIAIIPKLNSELVTQIDPWVILCETGSESPAVGKYSITADKLPTETTTVVLERKS
jgi:hypothetical protein